MKDEFRAIRKGIGGDLIDPYRLFQSGVGSKAASRLGQTLAANSKPTLVISTGFCGALRNDVMVGDVIVGTRILDADSGEEIHRFRDETLCERIAHALSNGKLRFHVGSIVSTLHPVFSPQAKRELGLRRDALAVDMESAALAKHFDPKHTRVLVLRTVSDAVDDELPAEVGEFLNEKGRPRIAKIAGFALRRPRNIKTLMSLKARADRAAATLTRLWQIVSTLDLS
jgi:adenosylhomocysteine nucleosidase